MRFGRSIISIHCIFRQLFYVLFTNHLRRHAHSIFWTSKRSTSHLCSKQFSFSDRFIKMCRKNLPLIAFSMIIVISIRILMPSVDAIPFFECKEHNVRLLQIMSFVCNNTQPAVQLRDACFGCFLRTATLPHGTALLIGLSQCSSLYLSNSTYGICTQGLAVSVIGLKPINPVLSLTCNTGYCEFVQCIRRVNALNLVNGCFTANLVNRDFNRILDRMNFYTNTTACILARARCSDINPITGDIQRQKGSPYPPGITNSVGTAGYYHHNAIQIGRNGDIKIIGLPSVWVLSNSFCAPSITLDQSPYNQQTCLYS